MRLLLGQLLEKPSRHRQTQLSSLRTSFSGIFLQCFFLKRTTVKLKTQNIGESITNDTRKYDHAFSSSGATVWATEEIISAVLSLKNVNNPTKNPINKLTKFFLMLRLYHFHYFLTETSTLYISPSLRISFTLRVHADLFAEKGLRQRLDNIPDISYFLPLSFLIISESFSLLATMARPNIARTVNTIKRGELR